VLGVETSFYIDTEYQPTPNIDLIPTVEVPIYQNEFTYFFYFFNPYSFAYMLASAEDEGDSHRVPATEDPHPYPNEFLGELEIEDETNEELLTEEDDQFEDVRNEADEEILEEDEEDDREEDVEDEQERGIPYDIEYPSHFLPFNIRILDYIFRFINWSLRVKF